MISLVASLIVATMLQAPIPAQRSSSDVVPQTRGILAAIVAGDFATVEKQFTDDMKAALPPGALAAMWAKRSLGPDPCTRTTAAPRSGAWRSGQRCIRGSAQPIRRSPD